MKHKVAVIIVEGLFYWIGTLLFPILLLSETLVGKKRFTVWFDDTICSPLNKWADRQSANP